MKWLIFVGDGGILLLISSGRMLIDENKKITGGLENWPNTQKMVYCFYINLLKSDKPTHVGFADN